MSDSRLAIQFGRNLTRCRKRSGLSQEELAIRASMHRTEIGLLERGERVPRIDTFLKLAGSLDVAPRILVEGIVWDTGSSTKGVFSVERDE